MRLLMRSMPPGADSASPNTRASPPAAPPPASCPVPYCAGTAPVAARGARPSSPIRGEGNVEQRTRGRQDPGKHIDGGGLAGSVGPAGTQHRLPPWQGACIFLHFCRQWYSDRNCVIQMRVECQQRCAGCLTASASASPVRRGQRRRTPAGRKGCRAGCGSGAPAAPRSPSALPQAASDGTD